MEKLCVGSAFARYNTGAALGFSGFLNGNGYIYLEISPGIMQAIVCLGRSFSDMIFCKIFVKAFLALSKALL